MHQQVAELAIFFILLDWTDTKMELNEGEKEREEIREKRLANEELREAKKNEGGGRKLIAMGRREDRFWQRRMCCSSVLFCTV